MSRGPFRQNVLYSTLCLRRRAKISRCDDIHPLRKESISGWATSRKQTLVNRVDRFAGKARDLHLCELRGTDATAKIGLLPSRGHSPMQENPQPGIRFISPKRGPSAYQLSSN